jgi:hypothetical protein
MFRLLSLVRLHLLIDIAKAFVGRPRFPVEFGGVGKL